MVGNVILRQVVKEQVRKLNRLLADIITVTNLIRPDVADGKQFLAEQARKDLLDIARKMAEIVTETWDLMKEVPVAKQRNDEKYGRAKFLRDIELGTFEEKQK